MNVNTCLQAVEKELNRQLQREKDKNRNLDTKVKDGREEVERLRLALPFDESTLTADKSEEYDIPYSKHSNHRLENKKVHSLSVGFIVNVVYRCCIPYHDYPIIMSKSYSSGVQGSIIIFLCIDLQIV